MMDGLFDKKRIFGMVHCLPLPGTMGYGGSMELVVNRALSDAETLEKAGVDALIIENMNDVPFAVKMDMEQTTALTAISAMVKERSSIPIGIDAAFCDWEASLCIAHAIGANFVRIPVFVDTVVTSFGIVFPCAREVVKKRKQLQAENILLLCDIQVKESYMLCDRISIEESAANAQDAGADAIIVTGAHTGAAAPVEVLKKLRASIKLPLLVGSGVNARNIVDQIPFVDGAIVGSSFKKGGVLLEPIDFDLTYELMKTVKGLKEE